MVARSRLGCTVWVAAMIVIAGLGGCDRGVDQGPKAVAPAPQPATQPAGASRLVGEPAAVANDSAPSARPTQEGGASVSVAPADTGAYEVVPAADLQGRLGRIVVAFPEGTNPSDTRIDVYKPGESKAVQGQYTKLRAELLPGRYDVSILHKRLGGVEVRAKYDTRIKVGVLRVKASSDTRIDVLDADGKTKLEGGYGTKQFGLPVGTYHVQIAGQTEPVTIEDGKVVDF